MIDFDFSFSTDRLLALADLDPEAQDFAERFFGLPCDADDEAAAAE